MKFGDFFATIANTQLEPWLEVLPSQLSDWQKNKHADYPKWEKAVKLLPLIASDYSLKGEVKALSREPLGEGIQKQIRHKLEQLKPWKKGPFDLFGVYVDCEWRSDLKWERVLPHIQPLKNRTILDVGCGSGYHLWQMVGEGAKLAVGIDPSTLFVYQFQAVKKCLNITDKAFLLPVGIEQLPALNAFDTVFSMGVLYHRKSPFEHFNDLKNQLRSGGELVLETLVVDGDENTVLVPQDRYAKMPNVYFIPSVDALIMWLKKAGFIKVSCVDLGFTTGEEQRTTEWAGGESLKDFLDPNNPQLTVEGLPAPKRAVILAEKP